MFLDSDLTIDSSTCRGIGIDIGRSINDNLLLSASEVIQSATFCHSVCTDWTSGEVDIDVDSAIDVDSRSSEPYGNTFATLNRLVCSLDLDAVTKNLNMSTSTSIINNNNDEHGTPTSRPQDGEEQQLFGNFTRSAQTVFGNTGRAISNFLPNTPMSLPFIQPKKFALPDKNVASQVLMYRQLLHTNCRPGLKLSRPYQNTAAQRAVLHMPWWEQGILETNKMVISYDNLVVRLWMHGAIMPFADLLGTPVETYINEDGLPPIPHEYWVERLGFQQPDPVTDFRSGGVLSLAMMVHM